MNRRGKRRVEKKKEGEGRKKGRAFDWPFIQAYSRVGYNAGKKRQCCFKKSHTISQDRTDSQFLLMKRSQKKKKKMM